MSDVSLPSLPDALRRRVTERVQVDQDLVDQVLAARYFILGDGEANTLVFSHQEAFFDEGDHSYVDIFSAAGGKRIISVERCVDADGDDFWKQY